MSDLHPRVIPVLLYDGEGLVKTIQFGHRRYIGDPLNTIRLFNELEVDEVVLLDIDASKQHRGPDLEFLEDVAREAFMPFCYGGGISSLKGASDIFNVGLEKVSVNHAAQEDPGLLRTIADEYGSQAVVGALDIHRTLTGKFRVYDHVKGRTTKTDATAAVVALQDAGAGEVLVNCVHRDGKMAGYDLDLFHQLHDVAHVPIIGCGGAGDWSDLRDAVRAGVDAPAAGSLFVYRGKKRGVLINYPSRQELTELLASS